jgi:hypothetical protein
MNNFTFSNSIKPASARHVRTSEALSPKQLPQPVASVAPDLASPRAGAVINLPKVTMDQISCLEVKAPVETTDVELPGFVPSHPSHTTYTHFNPQNFMSCPVSLTGNMGAVHIIPYTMAPATSLAAGTDNLNNSGLSSQSIPAVKMRQDMAQVVSPFPVEPLAGSLSQTATILATHRQTAQQAHRCLTCAKARQKIHQEPLQGSALTQPVNHAVPYLGLASGQLVNAGYHPIVEPSRPMPAAGMCWTSSYNSAITGPVQDQGTPSFNPPLASLASGRAKQFPSTQAHQTSSGRLSASQPSYPSMVGSTMQDTIPYALTGRSPALDIPGTISHEPPSSMTSPLSTEPATRPTITSSPGNRNEVPVQEQQTSPSDPATTKASRAATRRKFTPNILVDVAETVEEIFPFEEVARRHGVLPRKIIDALAAVVQLPLLRCATDKRRAGKLGAERMKEYREARKLWIAKQAAETKARKTTQNRTTEASAQDGREVGPPVPTAWQLVDLLPPIDFSALSNGAPSGP